MVNKLTENGWKVKDYIIILLLIANFIYTAGGLGSNLTSAQKDIQEVKSKLGVIENDQKDHVKYNLKIEDFEKRLNKIENQKEK